TLCTARHSRDHGRSRRTAASPSGPDATPAFYIFWYLRSLKNDICSEFPSNSMIPITRGGGGAIQFPIHSQLRNEQAPTLFRLEIHKQDLHEIHRQSRRRNPEPGTRKPKPEARKPEPAFVFH